MWLTVENIQEKESTVIADLPDLPHLVGSGQSVGGVVSETVGASSNIGENPPIQVGPTLFSSVSAYSSLCLVMSLLLGIPAQKRGWGLLCSRLIL
jgi:hypothetical protein